MTTKKTTTRKTTARKTTTKAKEVEKQEVEAVQEEEVEKTPAKTTARKRKVEIDRNELVPVRSARYGNLVYISKRSADRFEWAEYGDVEYVSVGELITMKSTQPRFLRDAWVIIDDEEAVEFLGLSDMYEDLFEIGDLDEFLDKPYNEMEKLLDIMPKGYKDALANKARQLIEQEQLDSNRVIRLLEEKLEVDLKIFEK